MSKKKTHEEYVEELVVKNPNIEVVGTYVDAKTKIKHKCKIDGCIWESTPNKILNGYGCPICGKNKLSELHKKSHEEYVLEVKQYNPNIEVIGIYSGAKIKITHHCLLHDIYWDAAPNNILQGRGCPQCGKEKIGNKKRKSHDDYVLELSIKNPNIEVVGYYVNNFTKIKHRCKIDGYVWEALPSNILQGSGCRICSSKQSHLPFIKTQEQYVLEVKDVNPDIEVLGKYINARTPILHRCLIHDIEWEAIPSNILNGSGCSECKKEKFRQSNLKTHEEYVEDVSRIAPHIEVIEEYVDSHTNILHYCKIHNYYWKTRPNNILSGFGCPICSESKGEKSIRQWLIDNNIEFIAQKTFDDCKDKALLPFDFYLTKYNYIIEYDGEQHYKPIEYFGGEKAFLTRIKHDEIKNDYCKDNGISLLRIPYYANIEEELNNFLFI